MIKPARVAMVIALAVILFFLADSSSAEKFSLQESVSLALKKNFRLQAAKESRNEAQALRYEAFTNFLPKFSTTYSYTRLNEPPIASIQGLTLAFPPPVGSVEIPPSTIVAGTRNNYTWSVDARQPVFAGGAISANYSIYNMGVKISSLQEHLATEGVILDVMTAYYNIIKMLKIEVLARQSVEQSAEHRNAAQNFFDEGLIPRNDLLRSEVQLSNAQQMLASAERGVQTAKSTFNTILGLDINSPVEVEEDILSYKPFDRPLEKCLKIALENRSEIKVQELQLSQANQTVKIARSEYFPAVNLTGTYARYGDTMELAGTPYKEAENWQLMAVAQWNFWEWGKTRSRVAAGRSRENQLSISLASLKDQIQLEVKDVYLNLREAEKQIAAAQKAGEQAEENYRIVQERYKEQVATSIDVIDAQTVLFRAKADYTSALSDYNIGMARLNRYMGILLSSNAGLPK